MRPPLCIAHGSSCVDGHAAAWVVHHALGDEVDFVFASYGDESFKTMYEGSEYAVLPSDRYQYKFDGRDVVIADFSYKRPVLEVMAARARSVLVLDHHKSAAEDLAGLPRPMPSTWNDWLQTGANDGDPMGVRGAGNLAALFDMGRSGAGITWDFFNPGAPRPWFINLVEDRDLWRFADDRSRPFHAAVTSYPLDFALWDRLYEECRQRDRLDVTASLRAEGHGDLAYDLIREGTGILRKHDLDVQTVIRTTRRTMVIGGDRVPVCNCPPWLASDVGHALTEPWFEVDYTPAIQVERDGLMVVIPSFSATYYDRDGRRNFSLRSRPEGRDVSEVCALYEGGGHHGAGGFEAPVGWEGEG